MRKTGKTTPKIVDLNDYLGERALVDAISILDERGFAQVIALGLEEQYRQLETPELEPAIRVILARLFRATALSTARLVCLAVETQKASGQTVDWKAVGEMLEQELPAVEELASPSSEPIDQS